MMRPNRRVLAALSLSVMVVIFSMVQTAEAHAVLLESHPALKGQVAGPDVAIKLRFNVRIDANRSRLILLRPDGSAQTLALSKQASADTLTSQAKGLAAGEYRLRWQVLASDGHLTRGEIPFVVNRS
jgi:methionine-rich copper-binding protein CopC